MCSLSLDIYWTYTGHILNFGRENLLGTCLEEARKELAMICAVLQVLIAGIFFRDIHDIRDMNILCPQRLFAAF
jgi:hypothetical protein